MNIKNFRDNSKINENKRGRIFTNDHEQFWTRTLMNVRISALLSADIACKQKNFIVRNKIFSYTGRARQQSPEYISLFIFFCSIYPEYYVQQVITFWRWCFADFWGYGPLIFNLFENLNFWRLLFLRSYLF